MGQLPPMPCVLLECTTTKMFSGDDLLSMEKFFAQVGLML
jgi:hypothetical protein